MIETAPREETLPLDPATGEPEAIDPLAPDAGPDGPAPIPAETAPDAGEAAEGLNPAEAEAVQQETQEDARDRYTDTELLGKSFRVRRVVQEAGTQTIKSWQHMGAKVRNAFATPGKAVRQFAFNRAKSGYERKEARLRGASSQRLLEIVSSAKEKMDRRGQSLQEHTDRMQGRVDAVHENANQRRQEYIGKLKTRHQEALAHKAVRSQLRSEGATNREARRGTKEIMAEMSAEFKQRIGGAAIVAETTTLKLAESQRLEGKAIRDERKTRGRVASTESRITDYDETVHGAEMSAVKISTELLPDAERYAEAARQKLEAMGEDDPDRNVVAAAVKRAEDVVAARKSELQQWRDLAKRTRNRSNRADERLGGLYDTHDTLRGRKATAIEQRETWRNTHDQDQAQLHDTVRTILEPPKPKEEDE